MLNPLKAGVVTADVVVAVSQGYAAEVTRPESALGPNALHQIFKDKAKLRRLFGIANGLDHEAWDPDRDEAIPARFVELGGGVCRGVGAWLLWLFMFLPPGYSCAGSSESNHHSISMRAPESGSIDMLSKDVAIAPDPLKLLCKLLRPREGHVV